MSDLPAVTGREVIGAFPKAGFEVARVCGSHHMMKRPGHRFVLSVPVHGHQKLKPGTLRALINDAGLTKDQFVGLLD